MQGAGQSGFTADSGPTRGSVPAHNLQPAHSDRMWSGPPPSLLLSSPHSRLSANRGKRAPSLLQGTAGSLLHPQSPLPPALRSQPNPSDQAGPARCFSRVTCQMLTSSLVSRLREVEQIAQRHTVRKGRATASVTSSPGGSRGAAQRPRSPGPSLHPPPHQTRGRLGSSISQGPSVFTRQASGRLGCLSAAHHPRLFPTWSTSSQLESSWEALGTLVASVWAGNPEGVGRGPSEPPSQEDVEGPLLNQGSGIDGWMELSR